MQMGVPVSPGNQRGLLRALEQPTDRQRLPHKRSLLVPAKPCLCRWGLAIAVVIAVVVTLQVQLQGPLFGHEVGPTNGKTGLATPDTTEFPEAELVESISSLRESFRPPSRLNHLPGRSAKRLPYEAKRKEVLLEYANGTACLRDFQGPPEAQNWRQRTFQELKPTGFIQYSAYRMSSTKFAAIGLQDRDLDQHVEKDPSVRTPEEARRKREIPLESRRDKECTWHDARGVTVEGDLEFLYTWEHHDLRVETIVVHCTLARPTSTCGGFLLATMSGQEFVLYKEDPESVKRASGPFDSKLTFCSPTLHSDLRLRSVFEWMEYHRVHLGVDRYIFYVAGVWNQPMEHLLRGYLEAGLLELTDFRGQEKYPTWFHSQTLAIHDCLYRTRFTSRWTFMVDFDEYLEAVPPYTLAGLLAKYNQKAWLSFGGVWWDVNLCTESAPEEGRAKGEMEEGGFDVERMVFHADGFFCERKGGQRMCAPGKEGWPGDICRGLFGELCNVHHGRRKYFVNPRKVELLLVHEVLLPPTDGLVLNARTQFRLNHYRWLTANQQAPFFCNETRSNGEDVKGWVRDHAVASKIAAVRRCPIGREGCSYDWGAPE